MRSAASCGFCMINSFGSMFGQRLMFNVKADFWKKQNKKTVRNLYWPSRMATLVYLFNWLVSKSDHAGLGPPQTIVNWTNLDQQSLCQHEYYLTFLTLFWLDP